jgi:hypothetical protein
MRLSRAIRAVLSAVCWILAVAMGLVTGGAFAGSGILCQEGQFRACRPQTWVLVLGVLLTVGFGVAGALLYKPKPQERPRKPWEYLG